MKKFLICLCFAWIIHFQGGNVLKVDRINWGDDYYGRRAYFEAHKGDKRIIVPWFQVYYIEEVA